MKTEKNILVAFILNLSFSLFEFFGGIFTGSVAIISDAVHDLGDATSIGLSFFFEKKSKKQPNEKYTYGYSRYSVIGSVITTLILLLSSIMVIFNAILRIITPSEINYNGMIIFAIIGFCVNFCAALLTRKGDSLNQRAINLHMIEDVLGWAVVLVGAIVMRFTDFYIIDPLMSIGVAVFILVNTLKSLKEALELFLEKTPHNVDINDLKKHLCEINGTGIKLSQCPLGEDFPVFQQIAPYVRDKSFILFSGEGQEVWKWIFENGKCRKVVPQIIWGE